MALLSYIITTTLFNDALLHCFCSVLFLFLVWCPCMVINESVQYNGGPLPDIMLLTLNGTTIIGEPVEMPWRGFVFAAYNPTY